MNSRCVWARPKADKLIPKVAYSPVAFNPSQKSEWSSPWGQAFALLKGIAEFPREAMTNRFFWQGIRTDEDALIKAMNVAGDYLVDEYGGRKAKQRAELELGLIKPQGMTPRSLPFFKHPLLRQPNAARSQ
jgi:hypothetical protein